MRHTLRKLGIFFFAMDDRRKPPGPLVILFLLLMPPIQSYRALVDKVVMGKPEKSFSGSRNFRSTSQTLFSGTPKLLYRPMS